MSLLKISHILATATPPGQSNFCPLLFYAELANVVIMLSAREVEKSSSEMIAMENVVVESNTVLIGYSDQPPSPGLRSL